MKEIIKKDMLSVNFKENLKIKENEEQMRLLDLQTKFRDGIINEEDIDYDDYEKLLKLYDDQNEKIKIEIQKYKNEIESMMKKIKK